MCGCGMVREGGLHVWVWYGEGGRGYMCGCGMVLIGERKETHKCTGAGACIVGDVCVCVCRFWCQNLLVTRVALLGSQCSEELDLLVLISCIGRWSQPVDWT